MRRGDAPTRAVVVWVPPEHRPEAVAERERKARAIAARDAEVAARQAVAETRETHAKMMMTGQRLVLTQLQKLLRIAESEDFRDAVGPVELRDLVKLAELVSKDFRLSTGQATENIAHAIGPSIDFSRLTQEERDAWRALALKGGAEE